MSKYPVPSNELDRIQYLIDHELIGMGLDAEFDVLAKSATLITGCAASLIALMEDDIQRVQSCVGMELETVQREDTVCQYTLLDKEAVVIADTMLDARTSSNAMILGGGIRFYAGVPIMTADNLVLGTICVVDYSPRTLTTAQIELLQLLAQSAQQIYSNKRMIAESGYFATIYEITQNLICVLDSDFTLKKYNPAFARIFSATDHQLLGQSFQKLVHEQQYAVMEALQQTVSQGQQALETQMLLENGRHLLIQWNFKYDQRHHEIFAFGRDITQETQERALLASSERKFRNFFENSIGLMSMHDLHGNILKINQKGRELLGYEEFEIQGLNVRDLLPEEDAPGFADYMQQIIQQEELSGIMTLLNKAGEKKYFIYQNVIERNADGETYVFSAAVNMSERRRLELDLLHTKQTLEQINMVAQVGGWEIDIHSGTVTMSEHGTIVFGRPEAASMALNSWISSFELDSQHLFQEAFDKAIRQQEPFDVELRLKVGTTETIWVRVKAMPEIEEGSCVRVIGIIQDIDNSKRVFLELEKKEAMLQAFVKYVPASVSMYNQDFDYISVSNQWCEEFNMSPQHLEDNNLFSLFPNIPPQRKEIYLQAQLGKSYKNTDEIFIMDELDGPQHYNWEVRPWHLSDGTIGGIIVLAQNITDSVLINEELKAAKQHADLASRAKSEFLANMSHEIRTPLNGVIGFSDLLMRTPLNEVQLQYLKYIHESGNSLLNIINDILDFSKIESGKLELFLDKNNIYDLTSQVMNVVLFQAQRKDIELLLNVELGLPQGIFIDDSRLKQVLVNLIGNAVKFTEEGEIELKVALVAKTDDKIKLRFSVRDTGIGIAIERQQRIFKAFTQEDSSVSKRYGGTGLGLTISNNLLKYMNSTLELSSEIGKGTEFYFELEADYVDSEEPVEDFVAIQRALVVDDNANNRVILQHMLQYKHIEAVLVKNGMEALQLLMDGEQFDLILVDYHMPILNGIETITKIRELFKSQTTITPLIILHTSSEEHSVLSHIRQESSLVSLMKPIKSDELYRAITKSIVEANHEGLASAKEDMHADQQVEKTGMNLSILVADDNMVNMVLNVKILTDILPDAHVVQAFDGLEALNACQEQQFDVILIDVQMPTMDGLEATRQIRALPGYETLPIIGITAGNIGGEREQCFAAGMSDFLAKPIRLNDLQNVLNPYVDGQTQYAEVVPTNVAVDIDMDILNQHFGDDKDFKAYFLQLIIEELGLSVQDVQRLLSDRDAEELKRVVHKLKGTSSSIGLQKLHLEVVKLESQLLAGANIVLQLLAVEQELTQSINLIQALKDHK